MADFVYSCITRRCIIPKLAPTLRRPRILNNKTRQSYTNTRVTCIKQGSDNNSGVLIQQHSSAVSTGHKRPCVLLEQHTGGGPLCVVPTRRRGPLRPAPTAHRGPHGPVPTCTTQTHAELARNLRETCAHNSWTFDAKYCYYM